MSIEGMEGYTSVEKLGVFTTEGDEGGADGPGQAKRINLVYQISLESGHLLYFYLLLPSSPSVVNIQIPGRVHCP